MNNKANTLVVISPGFPENEADSACLPAQQVFVNLLKKNYPSLDIVVIAFQYPFLADEYMWKGVRVISLNGRNRGKIGRLKIWFKAWKILKNIHEERRIMGIFSFWCGECALVGKWFAKKYFIEQYCWILGQDAKKGNNYVRWIRPVADELVAMSDFLAREFHRNHGIIPSSIIPNGIDPDLYDPAPVERDIDILGAGSLIPLKNYELFLHTIHLCRKRLPAIKVVICGKGPEEMKLKELIRIFNLEGNVVLAGGKEHGEVLRLMQRSRVFLHTSSYEGFSTVCLEALYAGAQVVSFLEPMERKIPHWHIVKSSREMIRKILGILQPLHPDASSQSVLAYSMSDSVRAVMELFDYNERAI